MNFSHWLAESEATDFTKYDLKKKYQHFNAMLFDNTLPDIPIRFSPLKGVGGHVVITLTREPGTPRPSPMEIRLGLKDKYDGAKVKEGSHQMVISNLFKRSEQGLDAILLHEMVHVYFNSIGRFGEGHGMDFSKKVRELSGKVGFDIPLTDNIEKMGLGDVNKLKTVGVIFVFARDGKVHVAVVNDKYIDANLIILIERWKALVQYNYAASAEFYVVASAKGTELASRYPVQRKLPSSLAYYDLKVSGAVEDVRANGKLIAKIP